MRHGAKTGAVLGLALALSACGGQPEERDAAEADAGAAETGAPAAPATLAGAPPPVFGQCRACHSVEPGRNMLGPSLHDIIGKPAASVPGFAYSSALKASGLTWDEATLDAWLANPAKLVPGNRMAFFGQADPAKRKEMIDYLAAQR